MTVIASLTLLESGNVEFEVNNNIVHLVDREVARLAAIEKLWNDKRLTDLLDMWIAADKGGVEFE